MTARTNVQLDTLFQNGNRPDEDDFGDLFDSYLNISDNGQTIIGNNTFSGVNTLTGKNTFTDLNIFTGGIYGGAAKVLTSQGSHFNTVTEGTASTTVTIAADTLVAGNALHIKSYGRVTSNNSTDTLTPTLKFGDTDTSATTTIATGAALDVDDDDLVRLNAWITIRTIGSSGTFVADGTFETDALGATKLLWTKPSTSINTTVDQTLAMFFDWSVANEDNNYIQDQFIVTIH